MKELTALEKHVCVACGAQAVWDPAKQVIRCPYCGTEAPFEIDRESGKIVELDLVSALRELPDELRGWNSEKRAVRCRSCNAVSVFDSERVGQNCQFCGSPELVDYEEIKAPIRPQSLLPFKLGISEVRDRLRNWIGSLWFAPGTLKARALVDQVRGIYLPYWTFDAQVSCRWTAMAGYYYQTTESYMSGGRILTKQVRHVRWVPASGEIEHFFDDEPVAGSRGISPDLLKRVEPWPTQELVPYDTAYLSGFVVEHYQVILFDAAKAARVSMREKLHTMCALQVPGDTYKDLQVFPVFFGETFKHILVPVWLLTYNYGARTFQVLVNGYTGTIAGGRPWSLWKILAAVVLILFVIWIAVVLGSLSGQS